MKAILNSVAQTILDQLGGKRFIAMTGAYGFLEEDEGRSLTFHLPASPGYVRKGIAQVTITLTDRDEYTMDFARPTGVDSYQIVDHLSGVYWDQLQELFTRYTGLATHL
jgi:hypothetical protein